MKFIAKLLACLMYLFLTIGAFVVWLLSTLLGLAITIAVIYLLFIGANKLTDHLKNKYPVQNEAR